MVTFRLHDFIKGAIDRMVIMTNPKGGYYNSRVTFYPDEDYEVEDPLLIEYLRGEKGDVRQKSIYSKELIDDLTARGISYEISKCGTCSNAKPRVLYNPFMEVKDDNE